MADLAQSLSGQGAQSLPTTDFFPWTVWSTWMYHLSLILVILSSKPVAIMCISMLDMLINLLRQNWNLPFCFKSHILYFALTPKCKSWVQTDNRPKIFNFFNKFLNSNCHCHIGIQNEKCIQMNTNKPSIGSVVLDILLKFGENILNSDFNFCKLKLKPACKGFLDCTETSCGLQIACRLGSVSKILGIPILIFRGRASNFWNSPIIGPIFSIHWGTTCSDLRKN